MRASGTVMVPVAISIVCVVGVQLRAAYLLDAKFGLQVDRPLVHGFFPDPGCRGD